MTDRYTIHSQLEHLQSKYIGTGHADTTKWEWLVNQHRDSYCSYMGHFDLLNYFAIAENESKARVRFNLMEKMLQPCEYPPLLLHEAAGNCLTDEDGGCEGMKATCFASCGCPCQDAKGWLLLKDLIG
ncbi:splicing factor 3b, subunit 5, 10kDa [Columba livia]|uniref:Splicing factor 3b, subunit 5, 10kDa n=1 Tax=Columba livia TaxID=8932 RepID=A0A2I0MV88_COLLI|nr:splicing factor 3B subunit 5 [Columba livia]PKK33599.1 splicing factor 3b, subunit 5, 10kDa [Columba livia]